MVTADGQRQTIVTDERWLAGKSQAISMGQVEPALWGLGRRSLTVAPFENYEQWRQALNQPAAGDPVSLLDRPGLRDFAGSPRRAGRRLVGQHGVRSARAAHDRPRGQGPVADDARRGSPMRCRRSRRSTTNCRSAAGCSTPTTPVRQRQQLQGAVPAARHRRRRPVRRRQAAAGVSRQRRPRPQRSGAWT